MITGPDMGRDETPDRAMLVGHVIYGGVLGRGFPAYLKSILSEEAPPTPEVSAEMPPPGIEGPTST